MTCFETASSSAVSTASGNASATKTIAMSVPSPVSACRRDLQIAPTPCKDSVVCGSFCSDDVAGAWKQFRPDIRSRPLVQQRRTERSHMIQQILHLLQSNFRICLLSSSGATAAGSTGPARTSTTADSEAAVLVTLQTGSSVKLLVHLAKHLELLIYRAAFSKSEYSNVATLLRRMQYFAMIMNCNSRWKVKILMKQQQVAGVGAAVSPTPTVAKTSGDARMEERKKMWLFSPAWWESSRPKEKNVSSLDTAPSTTAATVAKQGVLINGNEKCYRSIVAMAKTKQASRRGDCSQGETRRGLRGAQSSSLDIEACCTVPTTKTHRLANTRTNQALSPFRMLFQGHATPVLLRIFSFLDGANVVQHFTLNRFCYEVLPRAISDLRVPTSALVGFFQQLEARERLDHSPLVRRALLPTLEHLCVVAVDLKATATPDTVSMSDCSAPERKRKRVPAMPALPEPSNANVVASACPPAHSSTRTSGELGILALARVLGRRDCPQLRRLCLCSTFVNSFARNAIFHLTDAMSRPDVCPKLECLWLGGNALGDYGAMRVAHLLATNACPKLAFLDLRGNFIAQDGMRYLAHAFTSLGDKTALQQLCLGSNLITPAAFAELRPCFRSGSLRRLVFLGLDRNFLSRDSLRTVADELLAGGCPRLKEVCVGGNAALTQNLIADVFREVADSTGGATWGLFRPRSVRPANSPSKRRRRQ